MHWNKIMTKISPYIVKVETPAGTGISLFYGLPISLTIIFLIRKNVELLYSFLFIALPIIIIFGWIGLLDWNNCNKEFLKTKYKVNL